MARLYGYSRELRERAVVLVFEQVVAVGPDPVGRGEGGVMAETLRRWVRRDERDAGVRPGWTSAETERIRELERAKTANYVGQTEILKAASVFFAGSSTLDCHACNVRHGI